MEGKYLSPKADLTFKKIFGEHPDLVMSLLNALLPLNDEQQIQSVEYLSPEMVPENPAKKNSIVDVRCRDIRGRQFIVEMQMDWNDAFQQRVILNASKAVVSQLAPGETYRLLKPVYSLNLINDIGFDTEEFYHDYALVDVAHTDRRIEGLRFVFVELPKFQPKSMMERKMAVLWLRFMTEIDQNTVEVPQELLENPDTSKALKILERSAYTPEQLYAYDRYWDAIAVERTFIEGSYEKGMAEGMEKGMAEGMEKGRTEGEQNMIRQIVEQMRARGHSPSDIAAFTGLPIEVCEKC